MGGPNGPKNRETMVRGMFSASTTPAIQTKILNMMLGAPEATAVGAMNATFEPAGQTNDALAMPAFGIYADRSASPLANPFWRISRMPNIRKYRRGHS